MRIGFSILLGLLTSTASWGYANFIGHGYTSCLNCHFNPMGGGQLNDYGRVVSATGISSRVFYPKTWNEEKIGDSSGFLFRKPKQNWFRMQANYRGFKMIRNPGGQETKTWLTMQSDVRGTMKFGENDKFIASLEYGRVPIPSQRGPGLDEQKQQFRNYFTGFRPAQSTGIYAGLMDKVYGIRLVEHIAYSRSNPQVTQNDSVHGVMVHTIQGAWEGALHGFLGNLEQEAPFRMKGGSAQVERTVFDLHRVGASFLSSKNDTQRLTSYSVHGRFNIKEGSSVLTEIGQTDKSFSDEKNNRTARYGLLQTSVRPWKGLYVLSNIEYQRADIHKKDYSVRFGPGIQYFPIQRIELRADAYNTRNYMDNSARKDSWLLLLQTHFWL